MTASGALESLRAASVVFLDFDGVIKESVDVKTRAFVRLFESFGPDVADRVRAHHEAHGGMSRFQKIPLYLQFAGEEPLADRVSALCDRFAGLVRQEVIEAAWVPGIEAYLAVHRVFQTFVIVSATPQAEMEYIAATLGLDRYVSEIFGAPTTKRHAMAQVLARRRISADEAVMVGDSLEDRAAAHAVGVPFVLRRHGTNAEMFADHAGPALTDFLGKVHPS